MGIRGLTSFLYTFYDDEFFEHSVLTSSSIVIDGSNLKYHLYQGCPNLNSVLGGDYKKFYQYCSAYFQKLRSAGIKPLVVIDGAYDRSQIKFRTSLRRARDQVRQAIGQEKSSAINCLVIPAFGNDVFVQACKNNGAEVIQTNFEADAYVAELAKELDCPLLSNDSDFFVYDVQLIPLDYLMVSPRKSEENDINIPCKKFKRDKFLDYFNITDTNLLFLMSTLLGNDYVRVNTFERFFNQISLPKKKSMSQRQKKMQGLLQWLGKEKDFDTAVEKVMNTIPKTERTKLMEIICKSVEAYGSSCSEESISSTVKSYSNETVPEWMVLNYRAGKYPKWFMDVIVNRSFILTSQIEERAEVSSNIFALDIIEEICKLLTAIDTDFPKSIKMFTRENGTMKPVLINISDQVPKQLLTNIIDRQPDEKEDYLMDLVGIPNELRAKLKDSDRNLKCLFLSLYFWTARCQRNVPVLSVKVIAFVIFVWNKETTYSEKSEKSEAEMFLKEKVKKLRATDRNSRSSLEFVKSLSRLQSVMLFVSQLSALIRLDEFVFNPVLFWDGTFLFNLHEDVHGFRDENRFQALCHFDPSLVADFDDVCNLLFFFCKNLNSITKFQGKRKIRRKKDPTDPTTDAEISEMSNRYAILSVS